jgi:transaldolase
MPTMNKLEQLKKMTMVVADTGDIEAIKNYHPTEATTNPSLVFKAAQLAQYRPLVERAMAWSAKQSDSKQSPLAACADKLAVEIGAEILKVIPGRISTEVDSRLSFDTQATVKQAFRLIELYDQVDVSQDRVLIKIAATWEGIKAAETLQKEGINCNLTLLFSFVQAVACADAGVYLISPFVGRILDWHKAKNDKDHYLADEDPGVQSVRKIFTYYKHHHYSTIVMGASFRNKEQIEQLAGCDQLTISPYLLDALQNDTGRLEKTLHGASLNGVEDRLNFDEPQFRWQSNENAMATEKLAEGIRHFTVDQKRLEALLAHYQ